MTVVFVNAANYVPVVEKKAVRKMYCDPSHGWLAVKMTELEALGLRDKITSFSYIKGGTAYLEEDVDMPLYLEAMEADGYHITVVQTVTEKKSHIRYFDKFPSMVCLPTDSFVGEPQFVEEVETDHEPMFVLDEHVSDVVEYVDSEMLDESERMLEAA